MSESLTPEQQAQYEQNVQFMLLVKAGVLAALEEWEQSKRNEAAERQNVANKIQLIDHAYARKSK